MSIEVTIRNLEISSTLQTYAHDKASRLNEKFPPIEFTRVVLGKDGPFFTVAISIQGGQRTNVESNHKSEDMIATINAAFDKAEAQLRKNSERRQDVRS